MLHSKLNYFETAILDHKQNWAIEIVSNKEVKKYFNFLVVYSLRTLTKFQILNKN